MKIKLLTLAVAFFIPAAAAAYPVYISADPINLKVDDTLPYYYGQILYAVDDAGTSLVAYDLTGATVTMTMTEITPFYIPSTSPKINAEYCVITDAKKGKFQYQWTPSDVDTVDQYKVTFTVTKGSDFFTVPTTDLAIVNINQR